MQPKLPKICFLISRIPSSMTLRSGEEVPSNKTILRMRAKGVLLLLNIMTKRSTPFTQKGVAKLTKMYIYYSFCSILRPKGVLLLLNIMTKRSTPSTQKGVAKLTKINIYYSFCSILRPKGVLGPEWEEEEETPNKNFLTTDHTMQSGFTPQLLGENWRRRSRGLSPRRLPGSASLSRWWRRGGSA